ncbi:serine/threonine protein kinase [Glutamicibacter uratoxydans]|uniref:serine/threonine protein kinase n=1 Tax=Glutamicibacter uratoxydans TaxID=43667 RepID=UPI003D6DC6EB
MEEQVDAFAWPQCEGYLTLRPLQQRETCLVWLVQREHDQQFQVLKLVSNQEALAALRQPATGGSGEHLIEFHGVAQTDQGPALLAEYCPGGSLGQMVQARGALPLGETITALAPIAHAVAELHRKGLTHQDISPNNILLTAQGMPKLADFQEAQLLVEPTQAVGTPGFMAPEKANGGADSGAAAADIYALAACLWYLLSGQVPEAPGQRTPIDVILPQIPNPIVDLLLDGLAEDPARRPSADQFARTLFSSGKAEPLNWSASVPGFAAHLMSTIHPAASKRNVASKRRSGRRTTTRSHRAQSAQNQRRATSGRARPLKVTPGSRKIVAALVLGVGLIIGAGVWVQHWVQASPGASNAQPQAEPAQTLRSCAMQSDAQLPPCAQDQALILTELVELSRARDTALNAGDRASLAALYVPQSEQLQLDRGMVDKLDELGLSLSGLHTSLEDLEVTARQYPDVVIVGAQSSSNHYEYRLISEDQVIHQAKASMAEQVRFELRHVDQGWRISRVLSRDSGSVGTTTEGQALFRSGH